MRLLLVQKLIGILLMLFSLVMLVPAGVSILYGEINTWAFLTAFSVTLGSGFLLWVLTKHVNEDMHLRDGFLTVVLFWTVLSLFGALPFYLTDHSHINLYDAIFESVSGLTTTGATTLLGLDNMPRSLLFYRNMLQWLGGLGIIVLAIAVLPMLSVGGMQLYRAETLGPEKDTKLTPRITETAKALWYIYVGLTIACAGAYRLAGMNTFDAICHSFSTISIGGFSTYDSSFGHFNNGTIEIVAIIFMLIAAANFGLHFRMLHYRSLRIYMADSEFKTYILLLLCAVIITVAYLIFNGANTVEAIRQGAFQAVSIGTTSGFTTVPFSNWPGFLPVFLISISFIGGCAGSTGGGIKVVRFLLLIKQGLRELFRLTHPHAVMPIALGKKTVNSRVVDAVWGFFSAYIGIFALMIMLLLLSGHDEVTAFSAVAATLNNLGPGLGDVSANYASVGNYDKLLLCVSMLLGRLEIFTLLVVFTPSFWKC